MPTTRRGGFHQPLIIFAMYLFDDYLEEDMPLVRKWIDWKLHSGPNLTRSEKRRLDRAEKRADKVMLVEIGLACLIFLPLAWFVMSMAR